MMSLRRSSMYVCQLYFKFYSLLDECTAKIVDWNRMLMIKFCALKFLFNVCGKEKAWMSCDTIANSHTFWRLIKWWVVLLFPIVVLSIVFVFKNKGAFLSGLLFLSLIVCFRALKLEYWIPNCYVEHNYNESISKLGRVYKHQFEFPVCFSMNDLWHVLALPFPVQYMSLVHYLDWPKWKRSSWSLL